MTYELLQAIEAFQKDPPTTVFLLSMRAGSVGINLTAASHVFLLEPCINPALEEQVWLLEGRGACLVQAFPLAHPSKCLPSKPAGSAAQVVELTAAAHQAVLRCSNLVSWMSAHTLVTCTNLCVLLCEGFAENCSCPAHVAPDTPGTGTYTCGKQVKKSLTWLGNVHLERGPGMQADLLQLCPAGHRAQLAHGPEAGGDGGQVLCGQHC